MNLLQSFSLYELLESGQYLMFGLNIFHSEEKDWARHTMRQCPLQRKC